MNSPKTRLLLAGALAMFASALSIVVALPGVFFGTPGIS